MKVARRPLPLYLPSTLYYSPAPFSPHSLSRSLSLPHLQEAHVHVELHVRALVQGGRALVAPEIHAPINEPWGGQEMCVWGGRVGIRKGGRVKGGTERDLILRPP